MENQSGVVLNLMKHVLNLLQASEALSQTKIILSRNTVSDKSYQIERRLGFRQQNQSILYLKANGLFIGMIINILVVK